MPILFERIKGLYLLCCYCNIWGYFSVSYSHAICGSNSKALRFFFLNLTMKLHRILRIFYRTRTPSKVFQVAAVAFGWYENNYYISLVK